MFTDMVDYTRTAQRDEQRALDLVREQEDIVRPLVSEHSGRLVKSTGDGFLVEFNSVLNAAEAAIAIQSQVHERSAGSRVDRLRLRIGLHVGDVQGREGDILGDAVNLAARVLSIAEPEGIALTEQVVDYLHHKLKLPIEGLGTRALKGVDQPIPVYRVVLPWSAPVLATRVGTVPRVAVLPLRNISPDPQDEYFADGLTEELVSVLGQVRDLRVIARSSVQQLAGQGSSPIELGRELGATALLEGSVRKAGNRLRISLQLTDVQSQEGLWSQTFDRQLTDIFAVQTEVGERTAASLRLRLLRPEPADYARPPTSNLAAYGFYLQGLHLLHVSNEATTRQAIDLFRRAIEADPSFAAAYARLAHRLLATIGELAPASAVIPEVRQLVDQAFRLDPRSSEVHAARANLAMQGDQNWAIAEAEYRQALELNPSDSEARSWYGLLLRALQRYPEAEEQFRAAAELDPTNPGAYSMLASVLRLSREFERAERLARDQMSRILSKQEVQLAVAYTFAYMGRREEAIEALGPEGSSNLDDVVLRAILGQPAQARALLDREEHRSLTEYVPLHRLALLSGAVGDREKAIAYLSRDYSEGDRGLWYIYQGVAFDPVRSDPRFVKLLEEMRLPTATPFRRVTTGGQGSSGAPSG